VNPRQDRPNMLTPAQSARGAPPGSYYLQYYSCMSIDSCSTLWYFDQEVVAGRRRVPSRAGTQNRRGAAHRGPKHPPQRWSSLGARALRSAQHGLNFRALRGALQGLVSRARGLYSPPGAVLVHRLRCAHRRDALRAAAPTRSYVACARRAVDARLRKGGIAAARRAKDASRVSRYVQDLAERVGTAPGTLRDAYGRGAVLARGRRFGGRGSRAVASRPGGSVGPRPQGPQAATSEVSTCAPRSDESITDAAESGAHTCAARRRELACDVARHLPDRP